MLHQEDYVPVWIVILLKRNATTAKKNPAYQGGAKSNREVIS